MNSNDRPLFGLAFGVGFAASWLISMISHKREAWDSPLYFTLGIPLMCVVIFGLAYRHPERAWRWTLLMAAGQATAMAVRGGSLSLWPLSLVAMTVCSVPQFLAGLSASWLRRRRTK